MTLSGRVRLLTLAATLTIGGSPLSGGQDESRALLLAELQSRLASLQTLSTGDTTDAERAWLTALYANAAAPVWIDDGQRPGAQTDAALALLGGAERQGLDPAAYRAADLATLASDLGRGHTTPAAAGFELDLSLNVLRYLHDMHAGRVDPRTVGFRIDAPAGDVDFARTLRDSVAAHRLGAAADELAPRFQQYAALRDALARYRSIANDPANAGRVVPPGTARPAMPLPGARALASRLIALGDLPVGTRAPQQDVYDPQLVAGVRRFQRRHGLAPDGVLGPQTRAALNVPLTWRIRQVEMAMERLRWLPPLGDGPVIALNIPMFHLWGWDSTPSATPSISLDAIVGQAFKTETPVFTDEMTFVVIRPYWNVPPSLLKRELLPAIARDPSVIARDRFEIVRGDGEASTVVPVTPAAMRGLERGTLRLRQRPGPQNALGLLKFVFPNDANVYIHGTPERELFARSRRDFSHGCIRVEDPVALATWVLRGFDDWTRDRIVEATAGDDNVRVDLPRPIRVVIFYTTAAVMPEDGSLHFADDIYRRDGSLDQALRAARHPAPASREFPHSARRP